MTSTLQRLYGSDEPLPVVHALHAGDLSMRWSGLGLQHMACGASEIWRGLALVLRDPHWGTPAPQLLRLNVHSHERSFEVEAEGYFAAADMSAGAGSRLDFHVRAAGSTQGRVTFEVRAEAKGDLVVNRLGLCLLHPSQVAGSRVEVVHADGRCSGSTFPEHVPPWPPFMLVSGLRHEWTRGKWAQARLEGDVFETEDQRNNADDSFKTYSRSNMAPRPYRIESGTVVRQRATLEVETRPPRKAMEVSGNHRRPRSMPASVQIEAETTPWPSVGVEIDASDPWTPAMSSVVRDLSPGHLHLVWRPGMAVDWPVLGAMLQAANARLRLDVLLADVPDGRVDAVWDDLASGVRKLGAQLDAVAVFPARRVHLLAAGAVFPGARIGSGTPHFFVQLRRLDDLPTMDFASFTTCSIVHGVDDEDVMRGLDSLPALVATWRARHPGISLRVGPSDIAARSSPLGAQPVTDGSRRIPLAEADPRSRAQFGACWALGHVAGLAQAGVASISVLALSHRTRGVVSIEPCGTASLRPSFHVMAALGRPALRRRVRHSAPHRLTALALQREGCCTVLLGNRHADSLEVRLAGLGQDAAVQRLDAEPDGPPRWRAVEAGRRGRLDLPAYAVARVDIPLDALPVGAG
jgi:hypothetical protein